MSERATSHVEPGPATLCPEPAVRRLVQVLCGLTLYGVSMAMIVNAELGLDPWDVFHQGIARTFGWRLGVVAIGVSVAVLLLWIPIRQRPGLGTILNAVMVGSVFEIASPLLPSDIDSLLGRSALLVGGVLANAVATAMYIGAGLGPGPRDGLMTGLASRGWPVRWVRTTIEVVVLTLGWVLGGSVGLGTVLYAIAIGPLVHPLLPLASIDGRAARRAEPATSSMSG